MQALQEDTLASLGSVDQLGDLVPDVTPDLVNRFAERRGMTRGKERNIDGIVDQNLIVVLGGAGRKPCFRDDVIGSAQRGRPRFFRA